MKSAFNVPGNSCATPSIINCMAMAHKIIPIKRITIWVPLRPILLKIHRALTKQRPTRQELKNRIKIMVVVIRNVVLFSAYKITVVMEPGPINKGIATGTKIWLKLLRAWSNVVPEDAAVSNE